MSEKKKVAVFVIMGQSNATGHDLPMREEDKILTPLTNVFGLDRKYNQSFEKTELFWTGYTSGGMNLAEEQDIILLLGKGHEMVQKFKDYEIEFDEREVVKSLCD